MASNGEGGNKQALGFSSAKHTGTHIGGEDFNPSGFLLSSCVFKAKGHSLLVRVPPLHLVPFECYYLVLKEEEAK